MRIELQDDAQTPTPPARSAVQTVEDVQKVVLNSYGEIAKIIERGPSTYLFVLGTVVIAVGLAMKFEIDGGTIAHLSPGEFIAILILGLALLTGGALLLFVQYRKVADAQDSAVKASLIQGRAAPPSAGQRP